MFYKKTPYLTENAVTPESIYLRRREFMVASAALFASATASATIFPFADDALTEDDLAPLNYAAADPKSEQGFYTNEKLTPFSGVTGYNNFYEFGTDKDDPAKYAAEMNTDPWSVEIAGAVEKPGTYHLEDILRGVDLQERIYRLRCVEAWSMVIPWIGFPLATLIKRVQPTSKAKFIQFETLHRPEEMRAQRSRFSTIKWPYREGLRMDEAMHPLSILSVGLYGKVLPNQNGAPIRLVVPWKYGFKSIKSIVRMRFVESQPATSWNKMQPDEYGFYANVNPNVDHPRWSQKTERRLPSTLLSPNRIDTQFLNGYADQVAELYRGMDLTKYY